MPANDREVFELLKADAETPVEIDLLTFAIFAHERQQWCELYKTQKSREPTQVEIDDWISQITDWRYSQMRDEAVRFFDIAARTYLQDEMEAVKNSVFDDAVIKEVKAAGGFWRQLALALITGILTPIIIGLVLAAAFLYDRSFITIHEISDRITKTPEISTPIPPAQNRQEPNSK